MLLSRLHFSSELTSCGHWWLAEVNEMLRDICGVLRLRHGNRSWSRPLESKLVLGLYQHVSEPSQKRLSKAFIQRSVMPHQRLRKRHLLFEFPEKKKKKNIYIYIYTVLVRYTYAYRTKNTCTVTPLIYIYNFFFLFLLCDHSGAKKKNVCT